MKKKPITVGKMKLKLSEAQIQRQCLQYLTLKKIFHWRNNTIGIPVHVDGKFSRYRKVYKKGLPDIIYVKDGLVVAIEVKTEKGKQSPDQKKFEKDMWRADGSYFIVRSLDDLIAVLNNFCKIKFS